MKPVKDICRRCYLEGIGVTKQSRANYAFDSDWKCQERVWCKCLYAESSNLGGMFDGGYLAIDEDVPLACAFVVEQAVNQ